MGVAASGRFVGQAGLDGVEERGVRAHLRKLARDVDDRDWRGAAEPLPAGESVTTRKRLARELGLESGAALVPGGPEPEPGCLTRF